MGKQIKEGSSAVKIDPKLLSEIEDFITKDDNRLKYSNKKQFIDIAVYEYLQRIKNGGKYK